MPKRIMFGVSYASMYLLLISRVALSDTCSFQNSNLPKSIIGEVFPMELTLQADHTLSSTSVSAKERTLNLEDECRNKGIHMKRTPDLAALIVLNRSSTITNHR
jgi:hypothetical protein